MRHKTRKRWNNCEVWTNCFITSQDSKQLLIRLFEILIRKCLNRGTNTRYDQNFHQETTLVTIDLIVETWVWKILHYDNVPRHAVSLMWSFSSDTNTVVGNKMKLCLLPEVVHFFKYLPVRETSTRFGVRDIFDIVDLLSEFVSCNFLILLKSKWA